MARVFLLDAMGLAYRAYYAFIRRPLLNSRGENTSAIFGFGNSLLKIISNSSTQPRKAALLFLPPRGTYPSERLNQLRSNPA